MPVPAAPEIYCLVHVNHLLSIIADGCLRCHTAAAQRALPGSTIGLSGIGMHRPNLPLSSHANLGTHDCVAFNFCPRSVMLYTIFRANHPELNYWGGQEAIVHLKADMFRTIAWATQNELRWAFTIFDAGEHICEDRCDVAQLDEIDWDAVNARDWRQYQEGKQAEFLVENRFPWSLVAHIGVHSADVHRHVARLIRSAAHQPHIETKPDWYY